MSANGKPDFFGQRQVPRREFLRGAAVGGVLLGVGGIGVSSGLAGCSDTPDTDGGAPQKGGTLTVGIVGGGASDQLDAQAPTSQVDTARFMQLNETLLRRNADFKVEMALAEEVSSNRAGDVWTIRVKKGIAFHNGQELTADDVVYSLKRIVNPKDPKAGAASLAPFIGPQTFKTLDKHTVRLALEQPYAVLTDDLALFTNNVVPVGYDPRKPIGTGPFKFSSFTPGERSDFVRNPNYWRSGQPYLDRIVILDFPDDTARVNALLGGQVDAISAVPAAQLRPIQGNSSFKALISQTGNFSEFTMRVDRSPFNDVRVRQAVRHLINRDEMVTQALSGRGRVANDIFAPYDACYSTGLDQREQDLDKVKFLLKAAGQSALKVTLTTSRAAAGLVEAAQVLAEQAKGADVTVDVNVVSPDAYYGSGYLKWTFAQDLWFARTYLSQVAQSMLPASPYNETHWNDRQFNAIVREAQATTDEGERCALIQDAQFIEWDRGSQAIWAFVDNLDAYSAKVTGFKPDKTGVPLYGYTFREVGFV